MSTVRYEFGDRPIRQFSRGLHRSRCCWSTPTNCNWYRDFDLFFVSYSLLSIINLTRPHWQTVQCTVTVLSPLCILKTSIRWEVLSISFLFQSAEPQATQSVFICMFIIILYTCAVSFKQFFYPFRLHQVHEMLTMLTDVHGVCLSACLSRGSCWLTADNALVNLTVPN